MACGTIYKLDLEKNNILPLKSIKIDKNVDTCKIGIF